MSPAAAAAKRKRLPAWKDRGMLICCYVCKPVKEEAAHRDARSLTFYIQGVANRAVSQFSSRASIWLQNLWDLPQVQRDPPTCQFLTSFPYS